MVYIDAEPGVAKRIASGKHIIRAELELFRNGERRPHIQLAVAVCPVNWQRVHKAEALGTEAAAQSQT